MDFQHTNISRTRARGRRKGEEGDEVRKFKKEGNETRAIPRETRGLRETPSIASHVCMCIVSRNSRGSAIARLAIMLTKHARYTPLQFARGSSSPNRRANNRITGGLTARSYTYP